MRIRFLLLLQTENVNTFSRLSQIYYSLEAREINFKWVQSGVCWNITLSYRKTQHQLENKAHLSTQNIYTLSLWDYTHFIIFIIIFFNSNGCIFIVLWLLLFIVFEQIKFAIANGTVQVGLVLHPTVSIFHDSWTIFFDYK